MISIVFGSLTGMRCHGLAAQIPSYGPVWRRGSHSIPPVSRASSDENSNDYSIALQWNVKLNAINPPLLPARGNYPRWKLRPLARGVAATTRRHFATSFNVSNSPIIAHYHGLGRPTSSKNYIPSSDIKAMSMATDYYWYDVNEIAFSLGLVMLKERYADNFPVYGSAEKLISDWKLLSPGLWLRNPNYS